MFSVGRLSRLRDDSNHLYIGMIASKNYQGIYFAVRTNDATTPCGAVSPKEGGTHPITVSFRQAQKITEGSDQQYRTNKPAFQVTLTLGADLHQGCRARVTSYTANLCPCLRTHTRVREAPAKTAHLCFLRKRGCTWGEARSCDPFFRRRISLCVAPIST